MRRNGQALTGAIDAVNKRGLHIEKKNDGSVSVMCKIGDQRSSITIYCEKYEFQINVDNLLKFDKIEGQELTNDEAEDIVGSFLDLANANAVTIFKHSMLGHISYSASIKTSVEYKGFQHQTYKSVFDAIANKLGRRSELGSLTLVDEH